jgi:hypothetical protein
MANLRTVVIAPGSSSGQFFPTAADGNIYKLVEFIIDAHVVKTYYFIAAHAVAVDAWLFTDTDQIIGEVHRITSQHPVDNALKYWEGERDFGVHSVWVHKVWVLVMAHPANLSQPGSVEPYAVAWVHDAPFPDPEA